MRGIYPIVTNHHKPRVLMMVPQPFFQWRGSPIRVAFNVQALSELGYEVDLLVMPFGEDRTFRDVRIVRAPNLLHLDNLRIGPSPEKAILDIGLYWKARQMAKKIHYDVVHGVEEAGALGVGIAKVAGAKLVYEKHSDPASYRKGGVRNAIMGLYARVERFAALRADAVIATGEGLARQARAMRGTGHVHHIFDIPSSRVEPDQGKADVIRRRLQRRPDERLVMYIGSFATYQGVDLIFDAVAPVCRRHAQTRFVVVGADEEDVHTRVEILKDQGYADAVTFADKMPPEELPHFLAAADVLLSPRLAGVNTPLKLLDYMKAGRAIVATDTEANRLLLDEDVAELRPATAKDFADGIVAVLKDDERRAHLATQGRKRIDDVYNFQEFKRRLGECYAGLKDE